MTSHGSLFNSEIFSKGYGFVPKLVMTDKELTSEAKTIYCYLSSFSGAGMSSYPSIELMLSHLGMSRNRYFKHRKLLIERGYITIKKERKGGDFSNNIYILNHEPSACIQNATMQNADTQNATMQNATANSNSLKSNSLKSNKGKKDMCESSSHDKPKTNLEQVREDFETIWKEYPSKRRRDKEKCFTRYKNAIKDGETRENVYRGLMAMKKEIAEKNTENEFIRLSSTWFNNRNWNDYLDLEKEKEKEVVAASDWGWGS